MKKTISIFIILLSILIFSSCNLSVWVDNDELSVVTSNFPAYCFARAVCGNNANVTLLLPLGSESHSYEPTGRDIVKIKDCDLFIYTGSESDVWIDTVLSSIDKDINILKMTDCVKLLEVGHEHNHIHSGGEHHEEYDEHVWTSPLNAIKITDSICNTMCQIDEANTSIYKKNSSNYIAELELLHNDFLSFFNTVNDKTMIFGDRFPLVYFANEYKIEYHAAFPGCADHSEPSATTIVELIDKINLENTSTVYYIEFSNQNIANTLSEATGAKTALFYTCHNVSKKQFDEGEDYISLMRKNLETLKQTMK